MFKPIVVVVSLALLLAVCGCLPNTNPKTKVLPRIDLGEHSTVGLIIFSTNAEGDLDEYATQRFLELVSESQPGARFIELGYEEELLSAMDSDRMDPEAIKAIGREYNLSSLIVGHLDMSDVKIMGADAEVEALLKAKLLATIDGATIWTNSARLTERVAHVGVSTPADWAFDAQNPDEAYSNLIENLVKKVTEDIRVTYR